jgi:hypothetical protein
MNTTMDYGRADAQPEPEPVVDWIQVANRAIRIIAIFCFIAGAGLGVLAVREATAAPHWSTRPAEPHGTYRMTIVTPTPRPAAPHHH